MELGVYSFGDLLPDPRTGELLTPAQRMHELLEEIELADQVGLDVFGLGEHHRAGYVVSNPAVVLAAAATRTRDIKLTSAVTVLSSDDPVRIYQQFAELDLISDGRAEIIAGRGSFVESFPLFGFDLTRYGPLFEERLELLLEIRDHEHVTWQGEHRAPLTGQGVYPRPARPLPIWVAVGGSPESVVRAAKFGVPLAIAIIGGQPVQFAPFADLYRRSLIEFGHAEQPISINSHGFIADSGDAARAAYWPYYEQAMGIIGAERGFPAPSEGSFRAGGAPAGATIMGSPEEVAAKIILQHQIFGNRRSLLQLGLGTMPHDQVMRAIELFGTKVAPIVRAAVAKAEDERDAATR
ncbi:MAG: luciferase [Thermoleophilia bacterium]|nr:luciferase [Thermoleophilia bacterium]